MKVALRVKSIAVNVKVCAIYELGSSALNRKMLVLHPRASVCMLEGFLTKETAILFNSSPADLF